jgi:predicted enzyme related to lactoylglutathione lyase
MREETMSEPIVRWPFWIGIVTDDVDGLRRFYGEVLGLAESDKGAGYVQFDLDGNMFELIKRTDDPEYDGPRVQIGFEVTDIRATRQRIVERGAQPLTGILGGPKSGNYWAYFRDPDGNVFEITERTDGESAE